MYKNVVFKLPFFWEGIDVVTVVSLFVKKGDYVSLYSSLMDIETDEIMCEVPIDFEGEIIDWYVKPGDKLRIGDPVCLVNRFQPPTSDEFRKFYLEITSLLGLETTVSLDLIRAEIEKITAKNNT